MRLLEIIKGKASRMSRREFISGAGAGVVSLAVVSTSWFTRNSQTKPIILGTGWHTYEWVRGWGQLPDGMNYGNTHGCIVTDSQGRIYVNTDTENAVIVFDPNGKFIRAWGAELRGGAHGMCVVKEGNRELLFLAHHGRHEVVKTTLDGDVLMTLGYPILSGVYKNASEYRPTSVAVGPNGDIYVSDGYGLSWIHQYNGYGEYLRSWGGPGSEPGKMRTPHGIWLDTRGAAPVLAVADRENHRLQFFSLDGHFLSLVSDELRRPCHMHQRGTDLVVADLAGRVTILDKANKLITHLGDNPDPKKRANNGVPREEWMEGEFIAPHCARWDTEGNLYVMDWLALGRITRLRRVRRA